MTQSTRHHALLYQPVVAILLISLCPSLDAAAQTQYYPLSGHPLIIEAESGAIGSDFDVLEEDGVGYATIRSNLAFGAPANSSRLISFEVEFPGAATFDLFARVRVGPNASSDDSFLYGNGFGSKSPTAQDDWIVADDLYSAGFTRPVEVVFAAGSAPKELWKWVNLSRNDFGEVPATFTVDAGSLTHTFKIGGREDGFDIDKLAFGRSDLYYTVQNLDNVEEGSIEKPLVPPLADGLGKFLGNIYSTSQLPGFTEFWNQVIPENAGKWGSVERSRDVMSWSNLDAAYDLARDNGFPFGFHVLVWGNQQPSWIEALDPATQLEEIEEWFSLVAARYPEIDYLQVVNEPLHDPPDEPGSGGGNYIEALGGTGDTGWDWVLNAFRLAREHFPDARLMINEFNILNSVANSRLYLDIIELLQAENLIDGIGVQGHAFSTRASEDLMSSILTSLEQTGLPVQVTELDIDGPTDEEQLQEYQRIFPTLWEHPAVEGITLWGWRPGMWRTDQGAFLVREDGTERPALGWLRNYMTAQFVGVEEPGEGPKTLPVLSNYPNPFRSSTRIDFEISVAVHVVLDVHDMLGRHVGRLIDEVRSPGRYTVTFDAEGLASGFYMCRMQAGSDVRVKPMFLVR